MATSHHFPRVITAYEPSLPTSGHGLKVTTLQLLAVALGPGLVPPEGARRGAPLGRRSLGQNFKIQFYGYSQDIQSRYTVRARVRNTVRYTVRDTWSPI